MDVFRRRYHFVKLSNESPERGLPCAKIRMDDREGPSRAIRKIHIVALSALSLSFYSIFRLIRSLPSVFSHGRTQFHTCEIMLLWSLKNENRSLFSYGRVATTVRTRRYGGADASVRNQSQVLLTVPTGTKDAFFALERVQLRKETFITRRFEGYILKYLTCVFLIGTKLRICELSKNDKSENCDAKMGKTMSL